MSTNTPVPTVPKVRTFASDLTATRANRATTTPAPTATSPVAARTKVTAPHAEIVPPLTKPVAKTAAPKPVVPTVTTTKDAAIPPFHTLTKTTTSPLQTIDTSDFSATTKNAKPSVLATPGIEPLAVNSHDSSGDGTIITDTKHKRFSLFGAIADSLHEWGTTRKQNALRKKTPTYTVPEADRRKGVIQKATTQTGRASTADHEAVVNRIKSSQKTVRRTTSAVATREYTDNTSEPEPIDAVTPVTPIVTSQVPVAPKEQAQPTPQPRPRIIPTIPLVKKTVEVSTPVPALDTEVVAPKVTKTIAEKMQELEERTVLDEVPSTPVTTSRPTVTPIERPRITPIIPDTTVTVSAEQALETTPETRAEHDVETEDTEVVSQTPESVVRPNWSQALTTSTAAPTARTISWDNIRSFFRRTNNSVLGIAAGISVVVIGWYGIQTFRHMERTSVTPVETQASMFLLTSTPLATTTVVTSKESFVRTLHILDTGTDSLTDITITHPTTYARFSASEFFTLFGARVNANFIAAIDQVGFGSYHNTPWLILHAGDRAALQGGMLVWENSLDADLSPWFSTTSLRTTKKGITLFHDDTIKGTDVRILTDSDNKERIVYGFITPNELLITNNQTTFLNLVDKGVRGK